jgi:exodeoxyribonuclease VII small subunit
MPDESEPSFEESLTQLERVVESLERGGPELSVALARYEAGITLLRRCYNLLEHAEHTVAILTGTDEQGNPSTVPFDATATIARDVATAGSTTQADVRPARAGPVERDSLKPTPGYSQARTTEESPPDDCDPPF